MYNHLKRSILKPLEFPLGIKNIKSVFKLRNVSLDLLSASEWISIIIMAIYLLFGSMINIPYIICVIVSAFTGVLVLEFCLQG